MENKSLTPMLFPVDPSEFWVQMRRLVQEELSRAAKEQTVAPPLMETPGLTQKPLYKMAEVCMLFRVSRQTIYEWVRHGKLRPFKIRSRVYFLGGEVQGLIGRGPNGA